MTRQTIDPVETSTGRDETTTTHPAFAQISASRFQTTGTALYGSDFVHRHAIALRIQPSELHRNLNHDWHFARGIPHIEVTMSESQWATFISSLNMGQGSPCTVGFVNREQVPMLPMPRDTKATFDRELADDLKKLSDKVAAAIAAVEADLSGLSGKKRESVTNHLKSLKQEVDSNLPFFARQFGEHMERTVEGAKVEVAAYMNATVARAGLAALTAETAPLALNPGGDPTR